MVGMRSNLRVISFVVSRKIYLRKPELASGAGVLTRVRYITNLSVSTPSLKN
jgi:hypothetical protein